MERLRDNLHSVAIPLGEFDFNSISELLRGIPGQYTADIPGTNDIRGLRDTYLGLYFHDEIAVRRNLKVNVGVRYEYLSPLTEAFNRVAVLDNLTDATPRLGGNYFNATKKNFAPRVGIAWDPTGSGKTSVRAGYGIYDLLPLPYLMVNRTNGAPYFESGTVTSDQAVIPFSTAANALIGPASLRASYVQQNPSRAYNQQWNLTIQRQLTANGALTVGYVGSRANHLPRSIEDLSEVPPSLVTTAPDGHLLFPTTGTIKRINLNWGRVPATVWDDVSHYNSLVVDFSQRMSHGLFFSSAYTWSRNIDLGSATFSDSETNNGVGNPYPFIAALNKGPADFDIRHNFVFNFMWDIPTSTSFTGVSKALLGGWTLGGIFSAHTGAPFSVSLQTDRARTGGSRQRNNGAQRPDYNPLPGCSTNATNPGNPSNYIKTQCFSFPALGEIGNLGRNTLRAPGMEEFDPSLYKNWSFSERIKLQFRAEFFNLFNRANFQMSRTFLLDGNGRVIPTATLINPPTQTTSRQIQFGLKLSW